MIRKIGRQILVFQPTFVSYRKLSDKASMLKLAGRHHAVANLFYKLHLNGFPALLSWLFIHLTPS